jgi:hypothetical protein
MAANLGHLEDIGLVHLSGDTASAAMTFPGEERSPFVLPENLVTLSDKVEAEPQKFDPPPRKNEEQQPESTKELSPDELSKLSKQERTAYYKARLAVAKPKTAAAPKALTKAERRAAQEASRALKAKTNENKNENKELLDELILQGLSEEQAKLVLIEILEQGDDVEEEDDDDAEVEDLLASVRRWMAEHRADEQRSDLLHDFNMSVRFQGHVDSTPPDHLCAVLQVISETACSSFTSAKVQPGAVAKAVGPTVEHWAALLEQLYEKISDIMSAVDSVVGGVQQGVLAAGAEAPQESRDAAVVGVLMAIREHVEAIADDDLLTGTRRLEPRTVVLEKFIEFLEEALEEDDDDESE